MDPIASFIQPFSTCVHVHDVPYSEEEVDLFEFQAVLNCLDAGPSMEVWSVSSLIIWKETKFQ